MTDKLWGMHRIYDERIIDLLHVWVAIQTPRAEKQLYNAVKARKRYTHSPKA